MCGMTKLKPDFRVALRLTVTKTSKANDRFVLFFPFKVTSRD